MVAVDSASADILLVEDSDDDAEIVNAIFEKNAVRREVHRTRSGEEAVQYLLQNTDDGRKAALPKIVLLDINLPRMNGLDVLRRIRANYRTQHLPVFVFTSSTSDYNVFESYRLGVTSYIHKQARFEKFEEAVMETELYLQEYNVLILEDNNYDAELIRQELENSNLSCHCQVAHNRKEYLRVLSECPPDIIFADFDLQANFDGIQAIRLLREKQLNIPFILITGKLNEELAAGCLKEGMDDYLLKGNLRRFPLSLISNLRKKKLEHSRNEAFEKLRNSEQELSFLFNVIDEVFFSVDLVRNKFIHISPACQQVYGFPKKAFYDDPDLWRKCMHPEDFAQLSGKYSLLMEGEMIRVESRITRADGEERWIQGKLIPDFNDNNEPVRISGVIADITERKQFELKLEEKCLELSSYLYKTSHDLRAPSCSALGLIRMMKAKFNDENLLLFMNKLEQANQKMLELIDSLGTINAVSMKPLKYSYVDLAALLEEKVEKLKYMPEAQGVRFDVRLEITAKIMTDESLLRSVFQNLIQNAILYRRAGADSWVKVRGYQDEQEVMIIIEDNGKGIPLKEQGKVFEMFYRADESSKGSGLGLYIVKTAIEKLNGKLVMHSQPGKGTQFGITLPLRQPGSTRPIGEADSATETAAKKNPPQG